MVEGLPVHGGGVPRREGNGNPFSDGWSDGHRGARYLPSRLHGRNPCPWVKSETAHVLPARVKFPAARLRAAPGQQAIRAVEQRPSAAQGARRSGRQAWPDGTVPQGEALDDKPIHRRAAPVMQHLPLHDRRHNPLDGRDPRA